MFIAFLARIWKTILKILSIIKRSELVFWCSVNKLETSNYMLKGPIYHGKGGCTKQEYLNCSTNRQLLKTVQQHEHYLVDFECWWLPLLHTLNIDLLNYAASLSLESKTIAKGQNLRKKWPLSMGNLNSQNLSFLLSLTYVSCGKHIKVTGVQSPCQLFGIWNCCLWR